MMLLVETDYSQMKNEDNSDLIEDLSRSENQLEQIKINTG